MWECVPKVKAVFRLYPMSFTRETIPNWLTWFLSVMELVIVLGLASLFGYVVLSFLLQSPQQARVSAFMKTVNENWKAALILLVPLVYRPMRLFLENLEEAGPLRRKALRPATKTEETNPPKVTQ